MAVAGANRVSLGENSRLTYEQFIIRVREGSFVEDPEILDATDNGSGGFRENSRGPRGGTLTFDGFYRAADNFFRIAPFLVAGEEYFPAQGFRIYPDIVNSPNFFYSLTGIFVRRLEIKLMGTGNTSYSGEFTNQGPFIRNNA
jgi:hypothetical protein